ncbi:MAG: hypothetical protein PHG95_03065 [Patescibacteria group bacterium]|nr:hypothetical protein [Patescibacteria group bacterium]
MRIVTYSDIIKNKCNLAPHQLSVLSFSNDNVKTIRELLSRKLTKNDNGIEVGSNNYISKSPYYFLRTKSIQEESYLPQISDECFVPVMPNVFIKFNLKQGDLVISKDSNIGESVILDSDYPNFMLSGAMYRLPIDKYKLYLFAFLKNGIFKDQLDLLVPKGATIRHAGTKFLDCKIPFPKEDSIISYVENLTQSIINKEIAIKEKNQLIFNLIESELLENQKKSIFKYQTPSLSNLEKTGRMDVGLYCREFEYYNFIVKNYVHGSVNLIERGYKWSRGTSLEIKGIKTRINSDVAKEGFYELIIPTNISEYGTIIKSTFIGTTKKLKTIKKGDIIFGGEGFKKGRSFVVCENVSNIATNYHGIRIYKKEVDLIDSVFIRCFLAYWRSKGIIDYIGVGGSGGHCAPQYFDLIETPLFPDQIKNKISSLYHCEAIKEKNLKEDDFINKDNEWNKKAGIYDIDKSIKKIKTCLSDTLAKIANNQIVDIDYNL